MITGVIETFAISGVASPEIWGAQMFEFRRITLFCWEKRLSKRKVTIFSKRLKGPWPLWPPWLRLRLQYVVCIVFIGRDFHYKHS